MSDDYEPTCAHCCRTGLDLYCGTDVLTSEWLCEECYAVARRAADRQRHIDDTEAAADWQRQEQKDEGGRS